MEHGSIEIVGLSGNVGEIVTLDANGKIVSSGTTVASISGGSVDLTPYTLLTTTEAVSSSLQTQIDSIVIPDVSNFISSTEVSSISAHLDTRITTIESNPLPDIFRSEVQSISADLQSQIDNISGGSGSGVSFNGGVTVLSQAYTIPADTSYYPLQISSIESDVGGTHFSTSSHDYTVGAGEDGLYDIDMMVHLDGAGGYAVSEVTFITVWVNGVASVAEGTGYFHGNSDTDYITHLFSTKVNLVAGDTVQMRIRNNTNNTLTVQGGRLAITSVGGGVALSDDNPAALGTVAAGVGTEAARSDHVHQLPTLPELGIPTRLSALLTMSVNQTSLVANTPIAFDQSEGNIAFDAVTGRFTIPANRVVCGSITIGVGMSGSTQGSNYRIYDVTNDAYIPLSSGNRYAVTPTTFGNDHRSGVTGGQFRLMPVVDTVYELRLESGGAATINADRTSVMLWSVD